MYQITRTHTFKKQFLDFAENKKTITILQDIFTYLFGGNSLPPLYKDHTLKGKFVGFRECHIKPDLLLIYKKNEKLRLITLCYIGSHSDLFG